MEASIKQKIEESLVEKRENLVEWLNEASTTAKGATVDEIELNAVQSHLQEIDTALEKAEQGTLGECEVCCDEVDDTLLEMDYTACVCLSHLSPDERSKLEAELEFSQVIQRAMLPQQAPLLSDLDMAAYNRPAQIVSGDLFDFFPFHDGAQGIAIGDVVGHGVSAGILMSSIQTALHLLAPESDLPATVLERINQLFLHNIHYTTFATVFLASFDSNTRELTYAECGSQSAAALLPARPATDQPEPDRCGDRAAGRLSLGDRHPAAGRRRYLDHVHGWPGRGFGWHDRCLRHRTAGGAHPDER